MNVTSDVVYDRDDLGQRRTFLWLCAALAVVSFAAYSRLLSCEFIDYDDPDYVTANPYVQEGLTIGGVAWAFRTMRAANWHPVTWISHMVDCQLYGLRPAGHHLTSLLLHVANSLLLFGVLRQFTGALWRSAVVAALFAWHPLHIESVAWVSERKDVLSTFFWLLAIAAYARYAMKSKVPTSLRYGAASQGSADAQKLCRDKPKSKVGESEAGQLGAAELDTENPNQKSKIKNQKSSLYYLLSLVFFAIGLMSKPMVVTLPFVLLLLDYWPLRRSASARWTKLVLEKAPFFALAAATSFVTFAAQKAGGAVRSLEFLDFPQRVINAFVSYAVYLGKMIWPVRLALIYPVRFFWPAWHVILAITLVVAITALAISTRRSRPYVFVGWFWYLGTLVPVIGFVQVGLQSMADRYTYIPLIGIFIALVWPAGDGLGQWGALRRFLLQAGTALILAGCLAGAWSQAGQWRDGITVFRHALAVTTYNPIPHFCLGLELGQSGRTNDAMAEFNAAIEINPNDPSTLYNKGRLLAQEGKVRGAVVYYQQALGLAPNAEDEAGLHYNLANALVVLGKPVQAIAEYQASLRLQPDAADAHKNLGAVLERIGQPAAAIDQFEAALHLRPDSPDAEFQLGSVLQKLGRLDEARRCFAEAVWLRPNLVPAHLKLGLLLAQQNLFDDAKVQLERVIKLDPTNDLGWYNLAGVNAAQGHWEEAARDFGKVIELRPNDADARARRGAALGQAGEKAAAVGEYERAAELTGHREARILAALAQACAEEGRFEEAIKAAQEAQERAAAQNQPALAQEAAQRLERYRAGKP